MLTEYRRAAVEVARVVVGALRIGREDDLHARTSFGVLEVSVIEREVDLIVLLLIPPDVHARRRLDIVALCVCY